ncbi:MAG: YigZ family protein [Anaerolineales bacterium]|nr:YigZ family protein [Anaerolineales bacterium]
MSSYFIPKQTARIEYKVANSRFIGTIGRADTVEAAKDFIKAIRAEMPDATHHVYAFKVGYGASITEGMSDDGEPCGTSGPPTLAVLRGAEIGDVVLVITRYFGGTKLGTGGLVQAYSQTARESIAALPIEEKIARLTFGLEVPYSLYERIKRVLGEYEGEILDEEFAADVTLICQMPVEHLTPFSAIIRDLSAGQLEPTLLE